MLKEYYFDINWSAGFNENKFVYIERIYKNKERERLAKEEIRKNNF